jgi:hypothetical protein
VVEFAFVLLPLLAIVVGILDFGRAMNYKNAATQHANVAARFLAVNRDPVSAGAPSCGSLKSYLKTQADTGELADMIEEGTLSISFPDGTSNVGDPVQVELAVDFSWLPFMSTTQLGGSPGISVKGKATMRLEQPPGFGAGSC